MRRAVIIFLLLTAGSAFGFTGQEHTSDQLSAIWGFNRETLLEVNRLIDTVPGSSFSGGWGHRQAWGHSDAWFNQNWEAIAAPFRAECPSLTKPELKALAQKAWDIHMQGDITTRAGVADVNMEALNARIRTFSPELAGANNRSAVAKAVRDGAGAYEFVSQPANIERIQAEYFARRGFGIRRLGRSGTVIISPEGEEYVVAVKRSINDLKREMSRFPEMKFAVMDIAGLDTELAERTVTFRDLGDGRSRGEIIDDAVKLCTERNNELTASANIAASEVRTAAKKSLAASMLKAAVPYAFFGAAASIAENWSLIRDAYDNKAEWSQALSRTGLDFAGYTVTPMLIDGVLTVSGKRIALMASLKNAGMGYTLGFFCWNAGKEFCSYQFGSISRDEFMNRITRSAVHEAEMIPVNVLAYIAAGSGHTLFVPVVIIAGQFAVQRVHAWYEAKRWRNCIYTEDLRAVLGDELMNAFTVIAPEMRPDLSGPERRYSIAEPEQRRNIAEP